ncbi:hypothetical protein EW145_g5575 [Phellinidium pouzarii]|uniref:Copper transport protein n=1 Tax=Phellinidium pouzarii TaxID=167371 RepID=A0A4S4L488_9AGAM|nr:hypothetical protein EW145_g5575 [Phellinidium pouzarii]
MTFMSKVLAILAFMPLLVTAYDNGMDMSMDGAMPLAAGSMLTYLHFTPGDVLWFQGWVPNSAGAMVGTCIGLFLLAVISRWIAACRGLMEAHWHKQAHIILANKLNAQRPPLDARTSTASTSSSIVKAGEVVAPTLSKGVSNGSLTRITMPFVPAHDVTRGIMHAGQAGLEFAFMLAVMFVCVIASFMSDADNSFQCETLFGRYNTHAHLY